MVDILYMISATREYSKNSTNIKLSYVFSKILLIQYMYRFIVIYSYSYY